MTGFICGFEVAGLAAPSPWRSQHHVFAGLDFARKRCVGEVVRFERGFREDFDARIDVAVRSTGDAHAEFLKPCAVAIRLNLMARRGAIVARRVLDRREFEYQKRPEMEWPAGKCFPATVSVEDARVSLGGDVAQMFAAGVFRRPS